MFDSVQIIPLKGKKVFVLGAGVSGVAACQFLYQQNAEVTLIDDAKLSLTESKIKKLGGLPSNIALKQGINEAAIQNADLIILSPGIPLTHPAVQAAFEQNIPVLNEIDLSFHFLKKCKIIGITGSNGKSTTATMLSSIAKVDDPNAFVGGNLGKPLCSMLLQNKQPKIIVLELSSYQLELLSYLKLDVAIVTNLTPDHLDRYDSKEDYFKAKAKIFDLVKPGGSAILNQGDTTSTAFLTPPKSLSVLQFNVPTATPGISILPNQLAVNLDKTTSSLDLNETQYLGRHNLENAAAAVLAARAINITMKDIQTGLNNYPGIAHRLEILGTTNNILWVNDSKATNIESALMALKTFPQNVHLILGGVGKKSSYQPLVNACHDRVKGIYAIGEDAPVILESFKGFNCFDAQTLTKAVALAKQQAKPQDTILLAPACASFDQFANFAERGDLFRKLFNEAKQPEVTSTGK